MGSMKHYRLDTTLGPIEFSTQDQHVVSLQIEKSKRHIEQTDDELSAEVKKQITHYLSGKRSSFRLPIRPQGTEFQKKVWEELLKIPRGKTSSYKDIAQKVHSPKAYRAVGLANNKNPIPLIIPCHRVIGTNKKLTGYAFGLSIKKKLLELEKAL